ncbi:MAG TPA: hypothetical protein VH592_18205 [Gemmataceae bacterium]|jgi:hypothetical protein
MRRFSFGLALTALPAFLLSLMLAGCGSSTDTGKSSSSASGGGGEVAKETSSGPAKVLEPKGGVLKGKVTLLSKPDLEGLTKSLQKAIADKADQKDFCMSGSPSEITEQLYRIGDNGNLGNVFVWIRPAQGTFFKVDEKQLEAVKKEPVKIRQPHCAFIPHAAIAWVEYAADPKNPRKLTPTGQHVEIINDATKSHNTNYSAGPKNPSGNPIIEPNAKPIKVEGLKADTSPMTLKCNIHPWMDANVRLVDTPYYSITHSDTLDGKDKVEAKDPKFGTYEIKDLPVGKVRVIAWHEKCGYLNKGGGQGEEIEITEGKPTELNFEAKPQ